MRIALYGHFHPGFDRWPISSRGIGKRLCSTANTDRDPEVARYRRLGDSVSQTTILIDPFLTRQQSAASEEWKTDEEAVLNVVSGADYIFAGHSHADHTGDIPFIAKRSGPRSAA